MNIPIWKLAIVSIVSIVSITKLLTGRGGGEAQFKYRPFTACHSSSLFIKHLHYISPRNDPHRLLIFINHWDTRYFVLIKYLHRFFDR